MLVALKIAKNFISGYKLTNDNEDVFVELHSHGCFVKDKAKRKI